MGCVWSVLSARAGDEILKHPAYVPVGNVPGLPRILILGDSISINYTVPVRKELKGKANVHRPLLNCAHSGEGIEKLEEWLGTGRWDVILFNFGLHDAVKATGTPVVSLQQYAQNLRRIAARLEATGAQLIWASSTPVESASRVPLYDMPHLNPAAHYSYDPEDIPKYNRVAAGIMREKGIPVVDLYSFVVQQPKSLQPPGDVHFTREGYAALASLVTAAIRQALPGLKG
jgi:acyl-CoA thioesterase-1